MTDEKRTIDLEVEVTGTPEQVWQAIATGPGISSWYVPHTIEERTSGAMSASFGEGPEMQVQGRVAEWDPPRKLVLDGGDPDVGMAFEWLVEAQDGGTCIVRLINSGFGGGAEWDDQYDAMHEGWKLFLANLRLHLEHFPGQTALASLPMAMTTADPDTTWNALTALLGVSPQLAVGDRVEIGREATTSQPAVPFLSGTVAEILSGGEHHGLLVVDSPAPGTAFFGAEGHGGATGISVWTYLYGAEGKTATERDEPRWKALLSDLASELNPSND